jgi:hypothetical protein
MTPHPLSSSSRRLSSTLRILFVAGLLLSPNLLPSSGRIEAQRKDAAPGYEQALRARVEGFYGLLQVGKYVEAEAYITEASRQNFRDWPKGPFLSFEITAFKFETKQSGTPDRVQVTVEQQVFVPPSPAPVAAQSITNWLRVGDTWVLDAPKVEIPTFQRLFDRKPKPGRAAPPPIEVKFEKDRASMGNISHGQKGTVHFAFKNISDHTVSLEVNTFCECLVVKNLKPEYKPGEVADLTLELDSTEYLEEYAQTIIVKSSPGGAQTNLLVSGYIPRPAPPAEKPEK